VDVSSVYAEPAPQPEALAPAIAAVDVFRIYRQGGVETVALRGLDATIAVGEFVAVLGPSGSGKSTFLNLVAGLDQPSAGDVRAFGEPLARLGPTALDGYRARTVAIVFQQENLWPQLTAAQNIRLSLRLAGQRGRHDDAIRALERFDLADRADQLAGRLSGGEQQRVAIAAAAARQAPLVLGDEPTGELDTANEQLVLTALRSLRETYGATVVVVTHSPVLADAADRVVELRNGRAA
jgi:putative ABC transport system ATP-binding protein